MLNKEKYRFDDFTLLNYGRLLNLALENGYTFCDYSYATNGKTREIVWRHDVEFSVIQALVMAKMEAELGIKAHYFLQIHCEFYNTFECEIYELLVRIRCLGHFIGLHFDAHFWQVDSKNELERYLDKDRKLLEDLLNLPCRSVAAVVEGGYLKNMPVYEKLNG